MKIQAASNLTKDISFLHKETLKFSSRFFSVKNPGPQYRVLCLDGGGIRGIIPGLFLKEIEDKTGKRIAQIFNLIAGTSTGAILGSGCSLPDEKNPKFPKYTASEVLQFYLDKRCRENIFKKPQPTQSDLVTLDRRKALPLAGIEFSYDGFSAMLFGKRVIQLDRNHYGYEIGSDYDKIREIVQPKFIAEGIEAILKEKFRTVKFSQLLPHEVLVTTFNTRTMRHHIWSKQVAQTDSNKDPMVWQAARSSSAAPTYFPAYTLHGNEYIDGGVCMNNPALAAILRAKELGIPKKNLFCVSLGTGQFVKPIAPTAHFGPIHWAANIFDVTSCGISSQIDDFLKALLNKDQYVRLQVELPDNIPLDRSDQHTVDQLKEIGERAIRENRGKLDKIFQNCLLNKEMEL